MDNTTNAGGSQVQQHTRNATFDPAQYELAAVFDNHEEVGGFVYVADDAVVTDYNRTRGTYDVTDEFNDAVCAVERTCAHCGRTYGFMTDLYFRYLPTGELLFFGRQCAEDAGMADQAAYAAKQAANALEAARRTAERNAKRAEWTAANPEQAAALDAYEADVAAGGEVDNFLDDLARARRNYGALTEKQTPWPTKAMAKRAEWAAKREAQAAALANAPELAEGRYEVTGKVLSVKWTDNDFGGTFKMLVELADGNRVFGTCPASLMDQAEDFGQLTEAQVAFTAKVERSTDDQHFGFYSRPTKARLV